MNSVDYTKVATTVVLFGMSCSLVTIGRLLYEYFRLNSSCYSAYDSLLRVNVHSA